MDLSTSRSLALLLLASLAVLALPPARAADWPTFRGDRRRSATTSEQLDAAKLSQKWVRRSTAPPHTAWAGPAKWDAYAGLRGLRAMRNYDSAFGIAVAEGSVFVASTSDDSVACLDLESSEERWRFWADGPIRISPTVAEGRVYFGSDDGYAYCTRAGDGALVWKYRPPIEDQLIVHDGRMISKWPCRSGVLLVDRTVYCAFSMLPWLPTYLCALDAATGKPDGPGRYERKLDGATIEGPMAADGDILIAPQGRVAPQLFRLIDGQSNGVLKKGGGGSFVQVTINGKVLHGPGNKTGWVTVSDPATCQATASFKGCNALVLAGGTRYELSDHEVRAIDSGSGERVWRAIVPHARELIVAGETIFVGARDEVVAIDTAAGESVWRAAVAGDACWLAVADGSLLVSTDTGTIHCFGIDPTKGLASGKSAEKEATPAAPKTAAAPAREDATRPTVSPVPPGVVGRWLFRRGMGDRARRRGLSDPERRVEDLAGHLDGRILGEVKLRQAGGVEALEFDGQHNSVVLSEKASQAGLPRREITAEAWVRVEQAEEWGGILAAIQDNGSFERGWILGYRGSRFSFGVNATGGEDKLTYLTSVTQFRSDTWYHVVGTYDGTTLRIYINGVLENTSSAQTGDIHYPAEAFYEIGAYHDEDEYFRLTGSLNEVRLYSRTLNEEEIRSNHATKRRALPEPIQLARGPYARFLSLNSAEICWETSAAVPSVVRLQDGGGVRDIRSDNPTRTHRVRIDGLERNRVFKYQILTNARAGTPSFELDTSFNYRRASAPDRQRERSDATDDEAARRAAKTILARTGVRTGICLALGVEDARLVEALVRQSDLVVIGVETDVARVRKARAALTSAGIYGHRATVHRVESLAELPYTGNFANLVVSERVLYRGETTSSRTEILRMLRPNGGVALLGQLSSTSRQIASEEWAAWWAPTPCEVSSADGGTWATVRRGPLEGAGEWSHLYGRGDNAAYGGEQLGGARSTNDLRLQWLGRPGPRAQPDRNGRKPSPLSTNGRLFVQGLHRLIGLDAYNGSILWSLEIPPLMRFNMPRDSSNWCADDDHLFVAIRDACWQIDAKTGVVDAFHTVTSGGREDWSYDWGFVARHRDRLIGSAVKSGSAFVEFWGGADAGWYDARQGPVTYKVCSDNLFGIDRVTGRHRWTYSRGVILNSTITIAAGKIWFVECRHPTVLASNSRRVGLPELWKDQHLVALDLDEGLLLWEKPLETARGIVTFYMAYASDKLAIVASSDKKYDVYTFDASNGELAWHRSFGWPGGKGDHGKAMSRPAIVGDRLHVRPQVFDFSSGKVVAQMPGGGCGTYAMTANTAIFRSGNITLWDNASGETSSWDRLRPGCWLSAVPACGMLLAPEAGGGCSCGNWLETSVGFTATHREQRTQ